MEIAGLRWCGTRTEDAVELAHSYQGVPGLTLAYTEPGLWVFELPYVRHVEVFGRQYPWREHFRAGPVIGFAVRDLSAAVGELPRAGEELLGDPGPTRPHLRGPDGTVHEVVVS
jgi:hypothetical protein